MKKIALALTAFLGLSLGVAPSAEAATWSAYRIMLDPGHGGSDPGASGPSAPHEATLALRCANSLRDRIVNECGGTVKLTRTSDTFISLSNRQSQKGSYDPYIFCSIHLNAFNSIAKGTETYYYHSTGNSSLLANKVQPQLIANFKNVSGFTPTNRGVKTASYTVIMGYSGVPAILTEGLFVDNATEWSIINDNSKQGFKMWVQGHLYGFYDRLVLLNSSITNPKSSAPADTTKPSIARTTTVQVDANSFYAYAYATDNAGISRVQFPTWTDANGQDDIQWYTGSSGSWTVGGATYNYRYLVKKSSHNNENGPYCVHVYAYDAAGNSTSAVAPNFTFDTTKPTIARVTTVQNDANSFYAYAYATDNVKVTRVSFPTWTNNAGQDDLIWHEGSSGSWSVDGQNYNWRYLVKKSEHKNESGVYTVHVYAYDAAGNQVASGTSFEFDATAPVVERSISVDNDDASFYTYAYVTDNVKVTRVRFPAWTSYNGQDDLPSVWPEGTSGSWTVNGKTYNWRYATKKSDHNNEDGPYNVHIYANDAAGNTGSDQIGTNTSYTFGQSGGGSTVVFDDNITSMNEVWNYSATKGNLASATWFDSVNFTRDVAVNGESLYVLNCKQWGTPVITILDAYKGTSKGTLNVTGVSGGRAALGAIDMLGGKLIGVNAVSATHTLTFYKWDSESAAPTVWATAAPAAILGDQMSVTGDMTNGAIWLVNTTTNQVYKYAVANGAVNTTPTIITLSKAIGSQNGCATVAVAEDGTLWVDGKDIAPMHFKADGTYIDELSATVLNSANHKGANAVELIKFGSKTYITAANYVDASQSLSGGAFTLVNLTSGVESAAAVGSYPAAGLGTTRNTQFLNALTHALTNDNHDLYVWVAVAGQGVACYHYSGASTVTPPPADETPELSVNPTSVSLSSVVGETATSTVNVSGSHLKGDISLTLSGANATMFSISASTIAEATANGGITVTYAPTAEGNHSAILTIKSTEAADKTVALSGYAYTNQTPDDNEFNDDVSSLTEGWIYSTNKGNTADASWFNPTLTEDFTRDIAVIGENLYVLNCKQWGVPTITILDAYKGTKKGTVSVDGVSGGRAALGAIAVLGETLIGVNAVTAHELVFYKWDSESAAPTRWATTTPGIAMGDQMSVTGDMTSGAIWLVNTGADKSEAEDGTTIAAVAPTVYKYVVRNGVVDTNPVIISLADLIGSQNGCASVAVTADGTLWVDGKDILPTHYNTDGTEIEALSSDLLGDGNSVGANAIELIAFGSKTYMAAATYVDASATLSNGAISLINMTNGADAATQVGIYPSNGFGTTRNVQFINTLTHSVSNDGKTLNVWGVVAGQGIAYYKYAADGSSGIDNLGLNANSIYKVEWYNLQGTQVDGENLAPGIYIRRQGNDVKKVFVR